MGSFSLLQIVGSTLIGGFLLLMLFRFNGTMSEKKHRYNIQNIVQKNLNEVSNILEADLNKIGYCKDHMLSQQTFADPIIEANDSVFTFKTDVAVSKINPLGDGIVDNIKYYLGPAITTTPSKRDRNFYRKVNGATPSELNFGVTKLKFKYYNSLGDSLSAPVNIKQIAVVEYNITIEDIYGYNYSYNIDNTEVLQDDFYFMNKSKTGKIALKNFKNR